MGISTPGSFRSAMSSSVVAVPICWNLRTKENSHKKHKRHKHFFYALCFLCLLWVFFLQRGDRFHQSRAAGREKHVLKTEGNGQLPQ